jgi:hypothetical protein
LFNYNYDASGNKAKQRYIPLFGDGATASSGDLPSGFAVGCLDCYAYAGIVLKFRQVQPIVIQMLQAFALLAFRINFFPVHALLLTHLEQSSNLWRS